MTRGAIVRSYKDNNPHVDPISPTSIPARPKLQVVRYNANLEATDFISHLHWRDNINMWRVAPLPALHKAHDKCQASRWILVLRLQLRRARDVTRMIPHNNMFVFFAFWDWVTGMRQRRDESCTKFNLS
ncbi:hypothetical protein MJO29_010293 [Puccinia striiformis f. sp. tritici]|nr:hypothetical protein MJO29_010293 [Puccinia striiformis f. sp. tritici]